MLPVLLSTSEDIRSKRNFVGVDDCGNANALKKINL